MLLCDAGLQDWGHYFTAQLRWTCWSSHHADLLFVCEEELGVFLLCLRNLLGNLALQA